MIKFLRKPSVICALLLGAGLWTALAYTSAMSIAAEHVIKELLKKNNIDLAAINIKSINSSEASIESLVVGSDKSLQIERANFTYNAERLMQSKMDSISTGGVDIKGEYKNGTLSFGSLDKLFNNPSKSGKGFALPFKHFTTSGKLTLLYQNKPIIIPFSVTLTSDDGTTIHADLTTSGNIPLIAESASLSGSFIIKVTPDGADIAVKKAEFSAKKLTLPSIFAASVALSLNESTISVKTKKGGGYAITHNISIKPLTQPLTIAGKKTTLTLTTLLLKGTYDKKYSGSVTFSGDAAMPNQSLIFQGIDSTIRFTNISPLTTPPDQVIKIKKILAGVPLEEGIIKFQLTPEMLIVAPTEWRFLNGKLHTEAMRLVLNNLQNAQIVLAADKVELSEVVSLLMKKDIVSTGHLSGRIPLKLVNGAPMIENGRLASVGGGLIQYKSKDSGLPTENKNIALMLSTLQNFNYTSLTIGLNSKASDVVEADLKILGSNPDVYSGKSIELNISVKGNLTDILKSNIDAYQLPQHLQEQLLDSAR